MLAELDVKEILTNYAQLTLFLLMLSIGLSEGLANLSLLWRQKGLLVRCCVAAFVVAPIAAMIINQILPLSFPVRLGLALMAICPGAPMIYRKSLKGRALPKLAGSFQVTMAILSVILVPIWITVLARLYPAVATLNAATVLKQVAGAQLIPIIIGLIVREKVSDIADDLEEPITKLGNFLLLGLVLVILAAVLPQVLQTGAVAVIGALLFGTACVAAGHLLGGPEPEGRLTIAIANSTRNAGLALAIGTANFDDPGILGAIATYALISAVVGSVYSKKYQKRMTSQEALNES